MTAAALLSLSVLALTLLLCLWLVLSPLRAGAPEDPDAAERARLDAERERLYTQLQTLDDEAARPALERRAALTLRALDALPPAPRAGARLRPLALGTLALAALAVGAGALTVIPRWQLAALNAAEAQNVQATLALPALKTRAERTRQNADYLAWGKAAFDSGRYDEAVSAYGNALKLNPRQPEALRRLGILLLTRGERGSEAPSAQDATQAALLIRTAAQLAPNEAESQLLLGFALARFGEDDGALRALERYRTLDPQGRDADELITAIRARQNESDPGLRVYAANCASCHGPSGGGGVGPSLRQSVLSRDALRQITVQGKGAMPAFPNIRGAELEALLDLLESWQP
ncbi:c-type cytochrome [Deinococcus arcticus]|uniref:Cytochrome oxidase n=1 Tax=Deinococcus arcticus TaxID=2136176 RepID=A0A2T3W5Y1_9DEIO|nr:c-type cytochrome [Deinococcus arcticus]PTA67289.1 cytochrome oxidase [Deinococcus arcticus]